MKKFYLLLTFLLTSLVCLQAQVTNLGFENWSNNLIFSDPEGYTTSNLQSFFAGIPNVTKVTGKTGSAVRLETVSNGIDTIVGMATNADLGIFGISGGIPYTGQPDSVSMYIRSDIKAGDTANLMIIFKKNGTPFFIPQNFLSITGTQNSFTQMTFPLSVPIQPDSVMIIISSSNLFSNLIYPGSWIEIDDIQMQGTTEQIPNNEFEKWDDIEFEDPDGWVSTNILQILSGLPLAVKKGAPRTGNASLSVETVEFNIFGTPDSLGYAVIGSDLFTQGGVAFTGKPEKFTFYYQYNPVGNDSASVGLRLIKWNGGTGQSDSLTGGVLKLPAASAWTKAEMNMDWTGKPDPDSIWIAFIAGNVDANTMPLGSKLLVDDLMLDYPVGISTPLPDNFISLYPNPAGNYIYFEIAKNEVFTGSLSIMNIIGQTMDKINISESDQNLVRIDLSKYENGTYLFELKSDDGSVKTGKFIIGSK
jgi:Secretion system C-terminal sorting domain